MWHPEGDHPCIPSEVFMEVSWRCETRWRTYPKVTTHHHSSRDTLSQVEIHWIITKRSNPFVLGSIQNHTSTSLSPLPRDPSQHIFSTLPFVNFFYFSQRNDATWTCSSENSSGCTWSWTPGFCPSVARLNSITASFFSSPWESSLLSDISLYMYFVYLHLRRISVSLSPVIRCLIKLIPWTRKAFSEPCWVCVSVFWWFKVKELLMSHLRLSLIVFHSIKEELKTPISAWLRRLLSLSLLPTCSSQLDVWWIDLYSFLSSLV